MSKGTAPKVSRKDSFDEEEDLLSKSWRREAKGSSR